MSQGHYVHGWYQPLSAKLVELAGRTGECGELVGWAHPDCKDLETLVHWAPMVHHITQSGGAEGLLKLTVHALELVNEETDVWRTHEVGVRVKIGGMSKLMSKKMIRTEEERKREVPGARTTVKWPQHTREHLFPVQRSQGEVVIELITEEMGVLEDPGLRFTRPLIEIWPRQDNVGEGVSVNVPAGCCSCISTHDVGRFGSFCRRYCADDEWCVDTPIASP